ncbi:hypothetical protein LCGC14_0692100 [marine sediment metagenome]|uniref:Uncharacterized protein n=1 Tax=marine sediment metagenome TaxID=412755 RepID=A0A0F9QK91_9ZZZZ
MKDIKEQVDELLTQKEIDIVDEGDVVDGDIVPYLQAQNIKSRADMQREWIDEPTERGEYWVSSFIEGHYISPHIMKVIDYDRPQRGLEVCYDRDTIPVKLFGKEYRPKAKWMFIPEPELPKSGTFSKEGR